MFLEENVMKHDRQWERHYQPEWWYLIFSSCCTGIYFTQKILCYRWNLVASSLDLYCYTVANTDKYMLLLWSYQEAIQHTQIRMNMLWNLYFLCDCVVFRCIILLVKYTAKYPRLQLLKELIVKETVKRSKSLVISNEYQSQTIASLGPLHI